MQAANDVPVLNGQPAPLSRAAQAERDRLEANRLHTPNRHNYRGLKRNADHFNAEPENPPFVIEHRREFTKHNFLWFFRMRRRPVYNHFADTDLVSFLRLHSFCVPRTPTLIQSLKLKAIRYMSDFDMSDYSSAEVYSIIAPSVAAALVVTDQEELVRETIRSHSNNLEKYQPFFSQGQYRNGVFGYGKKSLV